MFRGIELLVLNKMFLPSFLSEWMSENSHSNKNGGFEKPNLSLNFEAVGLELLLVLNFYDIMCISLITLNYKKFRMIMILSQILKFWDEWISGDVRITDLATEIFSIVKNARNNRDCCINNMGNLGCQVDKWQVAGVTLLLYFEKVRSCYWAMTALTEKSEASIPVFSGIWLGCSGEGVFEEEEPPSDELPFDDELDEDDFCTSLEGRIDVEIDPEI